MSYNFFDPAHQTPVSAPLFGLCDDQNGTPSYPDTVDNKKWVATVTNTQGTMLTFTAIDHGVIADEGAQSPDRCDAMLSDKYHLFFVELKCQHADWISHGKQQLASTIALYKTSHGEPLQKHRKAYLCNRRHPHFHVITFEDQVAFRERYGFRLDIQAEIKV